MPFSNNIGTKNRNHCPFCLWSKHVDEKVAGDRAAFCHGPMEPIGLTFKKEIVDKYGSLKRGELMLVHKCSECGKISINRIAGDDNEEKIMVIFAKSKDNENLRKNLRKDNIELLSKKDEEEIKRNLFGAIS